MKLSSEEIVAVERVVDKSEITFAALRDDVVDHLCCVIEVKIDRGANFESALEMAVIELAPDGLHELQDETVFLLNSKKIIAMKKAMYLIGLLSSMSFVSGWVFGILHLPGARELSIYGFLGFAFVFLPMLAIDHFKTGIHRVLSEKLKLILGLVSGAFIGLSITFKMFHLSGTWTLMVIGAGIFIFGFLPFFFFSMYKKSIS